MRREQIPFMGSVDLASFIAALTIIKPYGEIPNTKKEAWGSKEKQSLDRYRLNVSPQYVQD